MPPRSPHQRNTLAVRLLWFGRRQAKSQDHAALCFVAQLFPAGRWMRVFAVCAAPSFLLTFLPIVSCCPSKSLYRFDAEKSANVAVEVRLATNIDALRESPSPNGEGYGMGAFVTRCLLGVGDVHCGAINSSRPNCKRYTKWLTCLP